MRGLFKILLLMILFFLLQPGLGGAARIKDIAAFKGIRQNQLIGYGLVIGLNGSGDGSSSIFTIQGMVNMLEHMGISVDPADIKVKNVAAVVVNAVLPPFAKTGKRIDVTVSSIGDAKSLQGGTLLLTPLKGVDGKVYALAQGAVTIGGFSAGGAAGGGVTKNHPTVGRITNGATIERELPVSLSGRDELTLILNHADFVTASRLATAINDGFKDYIAEPIDSGTVRVRIPEDYKGKIVYMMARMENLDVETDTKAKVVVNEKTGTVVIGENVRISTIAVAHGNLSIQINESSDVSQAAPFAPQGGGDAQKVGDNIVAVPGGATVITQRSDVAVKEEKSKLLIVPKGQNIGELVRALNAIGATPRDLITILQVIKAAGALQAELEIM